MYCRTAATTEGGMATEPGDRSCAAAALTTTRCRMQRSRKRMAFLDPGAGSSLDRRTPSQVVAYCRLINRKTQEPTVRERLLAGRPRIFCPFRVSSQPAATG